MITEIIRIYKKFKRINFLLILLLLLFCTPIEANVSFASITIDNSFCNETISVLTFNKASFDLFNPFGEGLGHSALLIGDTVYSYQQRGFMVFNVNTYMANKKNVKYSKQVIRVSTSAKSEIDKYFRRLTNISEKNNTIFHYPLNFIISYGGNICSSQLLYNLSFILNRIGYRTDLNGKFKTKKLYKFVLAEFRFKLIEYPCFILPKQVHSIIAEEFAPTPSEQ